MLSVTDLQQQKALEWIVTLLQDQDIPFVVCGGLAAIGYGASRPLNDIDLFVPDNHFSTIVEWGKDHITKPAQRYYESTEGWDVEYVQFVYDGIKIEVGNTKDVSIYDQVNRQWVALNIDFTRTRTVSVMGIPVPLMNRDQLIAYKTLLARPVDMADIQAMQQ
tara:strand:- start:18090 stop:18578 length:489 start_codon:yes stop_codon:yes gene_type:complete